MAIEVDTVSSHSIGLLGGITGLITGGDLLVACSVLVVLGRFVYDTIKFIHYTRDRKANGKNKTSE